MIFYRSSFFKSSFAFPDKIFITIVLWANGVIDYILVMLFWNRIFDVKLWSHFVPALITSILMFSGSVLLNSLLNVFVIVSLFSLTFDGCGWVLHPNIFDWNILCEHGVQLLKKCFVSTGLVQKDSNVYTCQYFFFCTLLFQDVVVHYDEHQENSVFLLILIHVNCICGWKEQM